MAEFESILNIIISAAIGVVIVIVGFFMRTKVSEHTWRKENILIPMFNEVLSLLERNASSLSLEFSSKWTLFDNYSRTRIDSHLREQLDTYIKSLEEFKRILTVILKALEEHRPRLVAVVMEALEPLKMAYVDTTSPQNTRVLVFEWNPQEQRPRVSSTVDKFVEKYAHTLLSSWSASELREQLIGYSLAIKDDWYKFFREWDESIFSSLVDSVQKVELAEARHLLEDLRKARDGILGITSALQKKLQERINRFW